MRLLFEFSVFRWVVISYNWQSIHLHFIRKYSFSMNHLLKQTLAISVS